MDAVQDYDDRVELNPDLPPLQIELVWDVPLLDVGSGADLTMGQLSVTTRGATVWEPRDSFRWAWIELLEWLGLNWSTLMYEDGLPFKADPPTVNDLLTHVRRKSKYASEAMAAELDIRLWDFLESHDVSRALEGAASPPLLIWREGFVGHVLTELHHVRCDWSELVDSLTGVGELIAQRLGESPATDRRVDVALSRWRARNETDTSEIVSIASGLDGERLAPVLDFIVKNTSEAENANSGFGELLAAARMTSGLSTDVILGILSQVADIPKGSTELVDRTAGAVVSEVDIDLGKPFEQGYALGEALRRSMGLSAERRFDAVAWLAAHNVEYRAVQLSSPLIDALACWGPASGPAVLINVKGHHARKRAGKNASITHEICHLLVDRAGALPALEVLGGRVNPAVEARARAFAAEVLLPRAHAGSTMRTAVDEDQAARLVNSLTSSHHVSREVVAWQARNSDDSFKPSVLEYLRGLVGTPWAF